ncbi:GNAT family N-acetyltransferase [Bacillus coahuilensis]
MIRYAEEKDLPDLVEIYNEAIRTLNATFDTKEKSVEERKAWFSSYGEKYPLIVYEDQGKVVGYASLSPYNIKPAYRLTVELSIYISNAYRGKGIGNKLIVEILREGKIRAFHTVISGITGGNKGSVHLHKKNGFKEAGVIKEVGYKFNQWHDVYYYQKFL